MKRLYAIVMMLVLLLSMNACGKQEVTLTDDNNTNSSSTEKIVNNTTQSEESINDVSENESAPDVPEGYIIEEQCNVPVRVVTVEHSYGGIVYYKYDCYDNLLYYKSIDADGTVISDDTHEYVVEDGRIIQEYKHDNLIDETMIYRYEYIKNFEELTNNIYNDETNELCIVKKYINGILVSIDYKAAFYKGLMEQHVEYDIDGQPNFIKAYSNRDEGLVTMYTVVMKRTYNEWGRLEKSYSMMTDYEDQVIDGKLVAVATTSEESNLTVESYELKNGIKQEFYKNGELVQTIVTEYLD